LNITDNSLQNKISTFAKELGFQSIGFAHAQKLESEAHRLEKWLDNGHHGKMRYMENHFDKRVDPTLLVPGAKTVISLSYNYHHPSKQNDPLAPKIATYAYGRDYHKVVKKKLKLLFEYLQSIAGKIEGRYFVDSAPVMEREWAARAGIGWIGKNTLLLTPGTGSYFFLAEMIVDLEMVPNLPIKDHCGTCTRCIDSCPTEAISPKGYLLDASKCISYLTIELREDIPLEFKGKMEGWIFGCDICQDVCPWNRFSKKHNEEDFEPHPELLHLTKKDWEALSEESYNQILQKTPVSRIKFSGLKRNIAFLDSSEK
jgi:epoxyqueuosine reductase